MKLSLPKAPSAAEWLFSAKSFAASMLALYLAFQLGLARPFWAMLAVYVVSQPLSGAVRSKAVYRVGGTALGSAGTVALVPALADSPELLSLGLALWVGLCLYVSLLDRTPRAYLFMLAGYTAALIGFPAVTEPATIFDVALARVEEITLGIVCATAVHSLIFPQSLGRALMGRLDRAIADAQRLVRDALGRTDAGRETRDRRMLASDITELRLMSTHLPFDTSHLRWTAGAIRALQDRLALLLPLLAAVEDRLHRLRRIEGECAPAWQALLDRVAYWSHGGTRNTPEQAAALRAEIDALAPAIGPASGWADLLRLNLAARLRMLVDTGEECGQLRRHIDRSFSGQLPAALRVGSGLSNRVLHRDRRLALVSALAAVAAILLCCLLWIVSAWPSGSAMAMMAAVFCCFFAAQDDPVPGIRVFLRYTLWSIPISAFYVLAVLPAVHGFEMLAMALAPVFLLLGVYIARPAAGLQAMAMVLGIAGTLALQDTGNADLVSFVNGMLGQVAGIVIAALCTRLLRSVSAEWVARRLLRAGWDELARLGRSARGPGVVEFTARMLDRIGLLAPRLANPATRRHLTEFDVMLDLRVGLNMTRLQTLGASLPGLQPQLRPLLSELAAHFEARPLAPQAPAPALLERIDRALKAVCAAEAGDAQRSAAAALVSLRCDLFAQAPDYLPSPA